MKHDFRLEGGKNRQQLGLITKEGLTPEGETQLASILVTLANGGVQ